LTQPWATLVAIGAKKLETRSWPTYYRGPLLVHAAKGFPAAARGVCYHEVFRYALAREGYNDSSELPIGAIIGIVALVGCVSTAQALERIDPVEQAFGNYGPGRFAWQLTEAMRFPDPIPCRGALGLWRVPDEIVEALREPDFTLGEAGLSAFMAVGLDRAFRRVFRQTPRHSR
jgi:hypothetical protein